MAIAYGLVVLDPLQKTENKKDNIQHHLLSAKSLIAVLISNITSILL